MEKPKKQLWIISITFLICFIYFMIYGIMVIEDNPSTIEKWGALYPPFVLSGLTGALFIMTLVEIIGITNWSKKSQT